MASIIFRVIAIIASLVAVYGWFVTRGKIDILEQEVANERNNLEQAEKQVEALQLEINMVNNNVVNLRAQLADSKALIQKLKTESSKRALEINNLKERVLIAQTAKDELEEQNKKLRQEISSSMNLTSNPPPAEIESLNSAIAQLEAENKSLHSTIALLKSNAEVLQQTIRNTEEQLAKLAQTEESSAQMNTTTPKGNVGNSFPKNIEVTVGQTASILKLDRRNGLVILDLGQVNGYYADLEVGLIKGYEQPVRVRIQFVQNDFSIAHLLPGSSLYGLNEGDNVEVIR